MTSRTWKTLALLGALCMSSAHAQQQPPLVKRFAAGAITMLQTRDGRMWSPLLDRSASTPQPSQSRYFNSVKAQPSADGEVLLVTTLYVPAAGGAGARSFEEVFEVRCDAGKAKRNASSGFSGEFLTGAKMAGSAPALTTQESAWLVAQACAARDFELEHTDADPFG